MDWNSSHLLYLFVEHSEPWLFYVSKIINLFPKRRNESFDISTWTFYIKISNMRERQNFFWCTKEDNNIRNKLLHIFNSNFICLNKPIEIGEILEVTFLKYKEHLDQSMFDNFASIVILIHVFHKLFESSSKEDRRRFNIHALDVFMRFSIVTNNISIFRPICFVEWIDAFLGIRYNSCSSLYRLFNADDSAFHHNLFNPCQRTFIGHFHRKVFMNCYAMLHHFVDT